MIFAVFDDNCKHINCKEIIDYLNQREVMQFDLYSDSLKKHINTIEEASCIFFMRMDDSGLKHQIDFLKQTDVINQWIIVLIDTNNSLEHFKKIAISNFRLNLENNHKDTIVICDNFTSIINKLDEEIKFLEKKKNNTVLLVSSKGFTGRKTTACVLKKLYPFLHFEICDENDIIVNSKYAEHIIVIGKEVSDFILSCPDDIFHKLTIFYNKVDESPISLVRFKKIKREIISLLNSNGWNLPLDFNRFYMGSIKYDMFYEKLQSEEVDTNDFIMSNSYYMWDKYGLPCPRNKYNSETIINFLKEIYVASRLLPTKQEYQRGVR